VKFSEARRAGFVLRAKEILIYFSAAFDRSFSSLPASLAAANEKQTSGFTF